MGLNLHTYSPLSASDYNRFLPSIQTTAKLYTGRTAQTAVYGNNTLYNILFFYLFFCFCVYPTNQTLYCPY